MFLVPALGLDLCLLFLFYAKNHRLGLCLGYLAGIGMAGFSLGSCLWPVAPILTVCLLALVIGLPLVCFVVALADMRWGVFATQTFYLLAFPVLSCPLLLLAALVVEGLRLGGLACV